MEKQKWPPLTGDYQVINEKNRVALVTCVSPHENFVDERIAIVGSQKTENLGVERIICNTVSNPNIRAFVVCGKESVGHNAGSSLIALWKNGVDKDGRIIGASGAIPYLENIDKNVVSRFREQVMAMENLVNVEDPFLVRKKIDEILSRRLPPFDKPALWVAGIGKRGAAKILSSAEKLIVSENVSIDPLSLEVRLV